MHSTLAAKCRRAYTEVLIFSQKRQGHAQIRKNTTEAMRERNMKTRKYTSPESTSGKIGVYPPLLPVCMDRMLAQHRVCVCDAQHKYAS